MGKSKVHKVMSEFKEGTLHSGSKHGPIVKSRKQAIAIAMSEAGKSKRGRHSSEDREFIKRMKGHSR